MTMRALVLPTLLLMLIVGIVAAGALGGQSTGRYYVNFARGDDANAGTAQDRPWKHAPGDPEGQGRSRAVKLAPGDHVIFAAGVTYRGSVVITDSGAPDVPIVFEGAPGGEAVIDGGVPLTTTPCASAGMCGGLANWRDLTLITASAPIAPDDALFADRGLMRPARSPDPRDDFYADEIDDMLPADGATLARGEAELPPALAGAVPYPGARIALWVKPNLVVERPILRTSGRTAFFDASGLTFYTDRPDKVAFIGQPAALDRPGEYLVLPDGKSAVAMLPAGARSVELARGRGGFELKGASHVAIRNLTFQHMTDAGQQFAGIAVFTNRRGTRDVAVTGNRFRDMVMRAGQGPVTLRVADQLTVTDNVIERIVGGSGIRLSGPADGIVVQRNRIRQVGRTAIMLLALSDALVADNIIADVRGVHGNGLSAYLGNHRVRFVANTVLNAKQPATFEGSGARERSPGDNDIIFANNLLIGTPDALGSLISWGGNTRGVILRHNVVIGGRFGLRLNPLDSNVAVIGNAGIAPAPMRGAAPDWKVEGNHWQSPGSGWIRALTEAAGTGALLDRASVPPGLCADLFGPDATSDPNNAKVGATMTCLTPR